MLAQCGVALEEKPAAAGRKSSYSWMLIVAWVEVVGTKRGIL